MGTIKQNFANNVETGGTFDAQDLTGTIPAANIANSSLSDITTVPPTASGGDLIQSVASDPPAPDFGDIWYNSTEQKIKLKTLGAGSWATGNNLNTGREALAGAGTQTAALAFGGEIPPQTGVTESYDGTSWTEVNDLNTGRIQSTLGLGKTYTAALAVGGRNPPTSYLANTENWNGTSWTEVNDLNTGRSTSAGQTGTNTSAIVAGGYTGTAYDVITENWNGTSWAEVGDLSTGRSGAGGAGSNASAAVVYGGFTPSTVTATEEWNAAASNLNVDLA